MIILISAILLSAAILIAFKLFEKFNISVIQAIVTNYLVASVLGFIMSDNVSISTVNIKPWFLYSILTGISLIVVFNIFGYSSQKAGIAITAVASKMSIVIPISIGILFYNDTISFFNAGGIIAALASFFLILQKNKSEKIKSIWIILLPILLFLGNGINDSLLKHSERNYIHGETITFLAFSFFFSLVIGIIILSIQIASGKTKIKFKNILAGIILGLLNWGSTYYFLIGLGIFKNSFIFPVFNVSVVGISAITGYFIFREKLSSRNWIGIALALISIILITFAE
ncbi:MAG TPA: EamA family transporter [Bacteroidales bacterium]|nr:EamA family transporter [Bacteroidales bacterium]HPS17912.1 EamA family transporter [Bacteroidales bacterium]